LTGVILLKSGVGAKIVLGVLGLMLGVGGVAAGANWHAHFGQQNNRRLFVGRIAAIDGTTITLDTRSGRTVYLVLLKRTLIRFHRHTIRPAALRVGDIVLVHVVRAKTGIFHVLYILIIKAAPSAQGP
jgi:hypothetical protein